MAKDLFKPSDSIKRRDLQSNVIDDGMIVQPPRYAQLGGLSGPTRGPSKNQFGIRPPGSTIHKEPVSG